MGVTLGETEVEGDTELEKEFDVEGEIETEEEGVWELVRETVDDKTSACTVRKETSAKEEKGL